MLTESFRQQRMIALKAQPTQLRRCLQCEAWMHSTGPDHRVCHPCKGIIGSPHGAPGSRVVA